MNNTIENAISAGMPDVVAEEVLETKKAERIVGKYTIESAGEKLERNGVKVDGRKRLIYQQGGVKAPGIKLLGTINYLVRCGGFNVVKAEVK